MEPSDLRVSMKSKCDSDKDLEARKVQLRKQMDEIDKEQARRRRKENIEKVDENLNSIIKDIKQIDLHDKCNFDVEKFVERVVHISLNNTDVPRNEQHMERLYAGGNTQSGKSAFKAVLVVVGHHFKIPTAIVTKGVGESITLADKLKKLLKSHKVGEYICAQTKNKSADFRACFQNHGAVVSAHTAHQAHKQQTELIDFFDMEDLEQNVQKGKFFLVFDEADDFIRTQEGEFPIELEKAHQKLLKMKPWCVLSVTATLMPVFVRVQNAGENVKGQDIFLTNEKNNAYYGLLDARPMCKDGDLVFLPQKALTPNNLYIEPSVHHLLQAAMDYGRDALLLDVSNPRVNAKGNIVDKGTKLRKDFPSMCFIVTCPSYLQICFPNSDEWIPVSSGDGKNKVQMEDLLNYLDSNINPLSLSLESVSNTLEHQKLQFEPHTTPIAILGYSKMERCVSYRSNHRVPTHMLVGISNGLSFDRLVQVFGRGTFMNPPESFKSSVIVLTTPSDWDAARCYVNFQQEIIRLLQSEDRMSMNDILQKHIFKDEENFNAFTSRTVGVKRTRLNLEYKTHGVRFGNGEIRGGNRVLEIQGKHREGMRTAINTLVNQGSSVMYCRELITTILQQDDSTEGLTLQQYCLHVRQLRTDVSVDSDPDNPIPESMVRDTLKLLVGQKVFRYSKVDKTWQLNMLDNVIESNSLPTSSSSSSSPTLENVNSSPTPSLSNPVPSTDSAFLEHQGGSTARSRSEQKRKQESTLPGESPKRSRDSPSTS